VKAIRLVILLCSVLFLFACNSKHPDQQKSETASFSNLKGIYSGVLPCADCEGLKTELTLYDSFTMESYRYTLKETYLNTSNGNKVYERKGAYNFERGNTGNEDAVIYVLDPDSATSRKFWLKNDTILLAVDSNGDPIDTLAAFVLKRQ
jgi:copper homeostasis protein (lipoprotein)